MFKAIFRNLWGLVMFLYALNLMVWLQVRGCGSKGSFSFLFFGGGVQMEYSGSACELVGGASPYQLHQRKCASAAWCKHWTVNCIHVGHRIDVQMWHFVRFYRILCLPIIGRLFILPMKLQITVWIFQWLFFASLGYLPFSSPSTCQLNPC